MCERIAAAEARIDFKDGIVTLIRSDSLEAQRAARAGQCSCYACRSLNQTSDSLRPAFGNFSGANLYPAMRNRAAKIPLRIEEEIHGVFCPFPQLLHDVIFGLYFDQL